jgi:hypothetical protein
VHGTPNVDQRDLAEVVAGAAGPDALAVNAVLNGSLTDHEEAGAALAFGEDHVALGEDPLVQRVRQPFDAS